APVIVNSNPNDVNGTGIDGYTIHAYMNSTVDAGSKCDCEGETYIGSAIVSGGVWSITHNLGLSAAASLSVTATQTNPTDPSGNSFPTSSTSQFSSCNAPLPVTLVSFEVSRSGDQALLEWATSSELNNKEFEIEKSTDGIHFISIGTIAGHGNSQTPQNYTYLDPVSTETSGIVYYRIKQIDVNGKYTYSVTRSLSLGKNEILVNVLENKELVLETFLADQTEFSMVLYTVHGQIVYSGKTSVGKGHSRKYFYFSELPSAMYLIQIYSKDQLLTKKLELF
ncbi:MAG: T9SS type A sorting domain-containing protein, partial [Cytophagaceae bacterium]